MEIASLSIDTYNVVPRGTTYVPIRKRPDLDFHIHDRGEVAQENRLLANSEKNIYGNPKGFPPDTRTITGVSTQGSGARTTTNGHPASYVHEGVLVATTNRLKPSLEQLAGEGDTFVQTDYFSTLHADTQPIFIAHFLGAFRAAFDVKEADPDNVYPVGLIHHTPVTAELTTHEGEEYEYPRTLGDFHGTVVAARRRNIRTYVRERSPRLRMEQAVLSPDILASLGTEMEGGLSALGIKRDEALVTLRPGRPVGVSIHLLNIRPENLTEGESVMRATDISLAIGTVYAEAYPKIFGDLPSVLTSHGHSMKRSPVPAHREVFHGFNGHTVYTIAPVVGDTDRGGSDVSGLTSVRSTEYSYTPSQEKEIENFYDLVGQRIPEAVGNLK
jgi:hypothetical protein